MVTVAKPRIVVCPSPGACSTWLHFKDACLHPSARHGEPCPLNLTGKDKGKLTEAEVKSWSEYY